MGFTEIAAFAGQTQLPLGSEEELGGLPQSVAPVQRADRISSLDVLRGSALLGILLLGILILMISPAQSSSTTYLSLCRSLPSLAHTRT
jgi:uncharacterized membrane protein YeiB